MPNLLKLTLVVIAVCDSWKFESGKALEDSVIGKYFFEALVCQPTPEGDDSD